MRIKRGNQNMMLSNLWPAEILITLDENGMQRQYLLHMQEVDIKPGKGKSTQSVQYMEHNKVKS